jgi:hypothetical protein
MAVASPPPIRWTFAARSAEEAAVAEDRKEPPFDGGSQPVPHQKEPVPGPGRSAAQWITILLCVLVIAAILVYIFGR